MEILDNPINIIITGAILILATIDISSKKDLKSQIVSLGVLGTFIGIFIGLQDFNPEDMKNSINNILLGLKTAFFTSIVGMGTALILATIQKIFYKEQDSSLSQKEILLDISRKLDNLEKLDITQDTDKIIDKLEQLTVIQADTRDETVKIYRSIDELRDNSNRENQKLIEILDINFAKMNNSLEIAIDKLSKGATEEIIKALEQVIQEFNQELQSSFGENFIKLNEAVINLLEWQNSYKTHIEHIEKHLNLSSLSIEKSKESLEIISSKNADVLNVYKELEDIIQTYDYQVKSLHQHLETYSKLSENAESMFFTISDNVSKTKEEFSSLTKHIKDENGKQIEFTKELFLKNRKELDIIGNHFHNLGEQIPKALQISLSELNRGLTSLTQEFQKSYKEIMDKYKNGIENERR